MTAYVQASKAGCVEAQNYLGLCYQFGNLVERDLQKGARHPLPQ